MNLNKQQKQLLTELASMSANGNDTLYFQKLESKYKLVIQELIEQSGIEKGVKNFDDIDEWGICFGVKNEGVLTILKNINGCLISVITSTDDVGRNFMYSEEGEKVEENVGETLDNNKTYTIDDLNKLSPGLGEKIKNFLDNRFGYTDKKYFKVLNLINGELDSLHISPTKIICKDGEQFSTKLLFIHMYRNTKFKSKK